MVNKNFGVTNRLQEKARGKKDKRRRAGAGRWHLELWEPRNALGGWCLGNTTAMEAGSVSSEGYEGRLQRADGWEGKQRGRGALPFELEEGLG